MNIFNAVGYFIVQAVAGVLTFVGIQTPINPTLEVTFSASPTAIEAGETATLAWTTKGAVECISDDFNTSNAVSGQKNISPSQTTTYSITCLDSKSNVAPAPGTWQLTETDYTDFACPVSTYELDLGNGVTESIPECPGSAPRSVCPTNQNGGCSWTNTYNPAGTACTGTGECKVSSASMSCVVKTKVYTCTPTVSTGKWVYWGEDLSDIFVFPGGNPKKNQIWQAVPTCPAADPEGKSCDNNKSCKINTTNGWLVTTSLYRCQAGASTPTPIKNINAIGAQVTVSVSQPQPAGTPGGGGTGTTPCTDGIDNDGDGKIDSADSGCADGGAESPNPQCSDGIDNNGNGLVDTADTAACTGPNDFNEVAPPAQLSLTGPTLVQKGSTATLTWSISQVVSGSCSLKGTSGDSWGLSGSSGSQVSSALTSETTYTLACTDLNGKSTSQSLTVRIAPTFDEQ